MGHVCAARSNTLFDTCQNVQKTTPNVLIASHLDEAPRTTQLAVLDMMRRGQITATGFKGRKAQPFLVVALLTNESDHGPLLTPHLVSLSPILTHAPNDLLRYTNYGEERLVLHPARCRKPRRAIKFTATWFRAYTVICIARIFLFCHCEPSCWHNV